MYNLRRNCISIIGSKNQIIFCDSDSVHKAAVEQQAVKAITHGLENDEFQLFLQFIVDNKTKKIVSAEALSRWAHPANGILPPGQYIPVMERNGIINKLDYYMFDKVCDLLQRWKDTDFSHISISCNFTRITLSDDNFIEKIASIAEKYSFDKSHLVIEITEDAVEKNVETAVENVKHLKNMGYKVALDNLGSGYTALANLCEYPIDTVKLDRNILLKCDTESGSQLFRGIVALAHSLKLGVVCEGVETIEQHDFVSSTECDRIQGWFFSKAEPLSECEKFIISYNQKHKYLIQTKEG